MNTDFNKSRMIIIFTLFVIISSFFSLYFINSKNLLRDFYIENQLLQKKIKLLEKKEKSILNTFNVLENELIDITQKLNNNVIENENENTIQNVIQNENENENAIQNENRNIDSLELLLNTRNNSINTILNNFIMGN